MSTQYCSLCLYQTQLLIPMRAEGGDVSANILHTVHKYIGILLTSNDGLCVSCWSSVDNFRKFCLLIAERQAKCVPHVAKELAQDIALECAVEVEVQVQENLLTNESDRNNAIECKNVSLLTVENINEGNVSEENVFKEQSSIMVVMPALEVQDNITANSSDTHLQLIKIEQPDTTEQQVTVQTTTDLYTQAERSTATLPNEEETAITEKRVRRSVRLRGGDMQQQMLTQTNTETNTAAARSTAETTTTELSARKSVRQRRGDITASQAEQNKLIAQHMQLTCDMCEFVAKSFDVLKAHFKQLHYCNGYAVCCKKRFYKRELLLEHIHVHRNPAYFSCNDCAKNFADRICLHNHMLLKHQPATALLHECAICSARFAKARYLKQHAQTHPSDADQQQCSLCAKSFANGTRLKAHMKNLHDKSKLFVCQHCGCEVSGKWCFVRHLAQHGAQMETTRAKRRQQRVQCTVCYKWLAHKSTLRMHMQRHADAASVYACQLCEQKVATLVALQEHKLLRHGIERQQHVCNVCARSFSSTRRLREHMTSHTGNHIYSCNYCDKRFKCSSNLYAHRKWKHPTEWAQDKHSKRSTSMEEQ